MPAAARYCGDDSVRGHLPDALTEATFRDEHDAFPAVINVVADRLPDEQVPRAVYCQTNGTVYLRLDGGAAVSGETRLRAAGDAGNVATWVQLEDASARVGKVGKVKVTRRIGDHAPDRHGHVRAGRRWSAGVGRDHVLLCFCESPVQEGKPEKHRTEFHGALLNSSGGFAR